MSQPSLTPHLSRCWTFAAGWPSQPWSTRKLESRGGHCMRANVGRLRPTVVAQTRSPRGDKWVKLVKGANGCTASRSCAVTATTIEFEIDGCARPGLTTSHPGAARNVGGLAATVEEAAAATPAAAQATTPRQRPSGRRALIPEIYALTRA